MAETKINYDKMNHFIANPEWTLQEMTKQYKERAHVYDKEMEHMVYTGPDHIVKEVMKYFPSQEYIRIVDCGAGTGLVGEKLREQGYHNLDAIEACQEMLDEAQKKGVYQRYICQLIGPNSLDIEDNTYDCTIASGFVCPGQIFIECLHEMIRITKSGGKVILTCREINIAGDRFLRENLDPTLQRLRDEQILKWVKKERVPNFLHDHIGMLLVMEPM